MFSLVHNVPGHMDAAGGSMGQGVGNAGAVADDVQALVTAFQMLVHFHFHIIELDFHTVEQGVVVGSTGSHLIQRIDHFDDAVQNSLGQHQAQVTGGGLQGGGEEGFLNADGVGPAAPDQIAEPLDNDAAAQHVAEPGDGEFLYQ